ncbi:ABC transporter ATP-binding protein [uncultured Dubosiella sp.]|nr:ABC transporter ATP-binding protein [uncultured Dubosiella sp.]
MYDFRIASITILIVLAAFGFAKIISEKQAVYFSKFKEIQEKISLAIHNDFLNQFTIIQLGIGKFVKNKLAKILENRVIRKLSLYTSLDEAMLLFMTEFIPIAVFCSGILLLNHKENGIGVALSLMLIAQKLNEPVIVMAELYSDRKNAEQVYERIKDIYARPADSLERKKIAGKFERLVFDLNGYAYDGNFQNKKSGKVKAEIKKGDMVTIQGASGCGKSTVLKLITRLIDPKNMDGALYYNGISLTEFERDSLYNHILMIEQDPPIIEGSLRENLELGDSFSESEIFEACELAGLSKWIENRGA